MESIIKRRHAVRHRAIALLCVVALCCSVLPVRADETGGEDIEGWNWNKFFDYAACGLAAATAVTSGGMTIVLAVLACGKALTTHFST